MRQNPGPAEVLDVADGALPFLLQFVAAALQAAVQFVQPVLNLLLVGLKEGRIGLRLLEEGRHAEVLAVDQLVEAEFQVARDGLRFPQPFGGDLRQQRIEGLFDQDQLGGLAVGQAVAAGNLRALGREHQVQENGRLADGHCAVHARLNDEQLAVQAVAPAVLDGGREHVEAAGGLAVQVVEHGAPPQVVANPVADVLADGLEQRMAGRDPLRRGVLRATAPCRRRSAGIRGPACRSGVPAGRRWAARCEGCGRGGRRGDPLGLRLLGDGPRPAARPG